MTNLLEIREAIRQFYSKNEVYVKPVIKFVLALISLLAVNSTLGYMDLLNHGVIVLMVALMCSFMPQNFVLLVSGLFILLHCYSLALECAAVMGAAMLLLFFFYFRFAPKDTLVALLTPILFVLKVPFAVPVAVGLLGGPISIVSMACGILIYYLLRYVSDNVSVFSAQDAQTGSVKLRLMIDGILDNRAMLVTIIVFSLVVVLVYGLRRMAVKHAWNIAIMAGIAANAILLLIFEFMMDLNFSVLGIILGSAVSFGICQIIRFMEFNVDYSRTEIVQFEDDEYYYYVKAIPKNTVAVSDKKVKKINRQHKKGSAKQVKKVTTIKTSNGVSRTTVRNNEEKMKK